ncbi:PEP-CTERM sorting domain-containing protein [Pseudoduganella umbonata]|uniref:PEP-CTERM sorting domain-containing protein n=1 Tax=Pseudoduganella umbonata TaxID=864828 RepID=A0A4P8HME1_9BURK|nr:PEP-CTERM sorting domain-containing protein [Pseudoduganella umbonata]MBB3219506.1 hypothetical protein [Pseudoduganella umbonata]QCP09584.1 PEP-CTERM sorting domain-containing protein [Pseudoduganella umbonata]
MKTIFTTLSAVAIGAALFAPAYAVETPVTVTAQAHDVQKTVVAAFPTRRAGTSVNVETWDVSTATGSQFLALCIEPGQAMGSGPQSYAASSFSFATAARQESIERLYGLYYNQISGATEASKDLSLSFQLALWELYNDDATLASGTIAMNNTVTTNSLGQKRGNGVGEWTGADITVNVANEMLAAAQNSDIKYTQTYTFTRYTSVTSQDFLVAQADAVSPVPEPSTYAMLGLGLAVVGFTARRRSKQ